MKPIMKLMKPYNIIHKQFSTEYLWDIGPTLEFAVCRIGIEPNSNHTLPIFNIIPLV